MLRSVFNGKKVNEKVQHMAPVIVSLERLHEFSSAESFATWLGHHHASETEVWIKIHKVGSGLTSITAKEAIDEVLCWGWIDAIRKAFDDQSFLQRYTPRGKKSIWSQVNVDNVARLTSEGRMTEFGLKQVSAAKLDGRWQRAYGSGKYMLISADLQAAIDANPAASAMLAKLNEKNRFALAFRMHNLKTEAGRRKKIETFVAMLARGETLYPQGNK